MSNMSNPVQKTYIQMNDPKYDEILHGIRNSYRNSCILWMEEIKNEFLDTEYNKQKQSLIDLRGEDKIKELSLYHGTKEEIANIIIQEGFNPLVNRTSAYGKGTYFARDAMYSKDYSPPGKENEISFMLICSVLIGVVHKYGSCKEISTKIHDNSVDSLQNPSIYVTPYQYGAIPRYLVAFYKNV